MIRNLITLLVLTAFVYSCQQEKAPIDKPEWADHYSQHDLNGTFVLYNLDSKQAMVYNPERADSMFIPASTFKIFNSLVSLQEEVIDEQTIIPWDSVRRGIESWNEDMWMTKAFPRSCVWYYQELARRVGEERMQYWLDTLGYGNHTMGAPIDLFWLEGELAISAHQQIAFLEQLYHQNLIFDKEVQTRVKSLMLADSTTAYQIYAKTGWGMRLDKQVGWYVGFVETAEGKWAFANNIDIHSIHDLRHRKDILYRILLQEQIIQSRITQEN